MTKYNMETISFLIGSFKDIINSFGQSSKSVEFYKRQVNNLVSIRQVSANDINFVDRLIGMENTNSVKWEKALEKLNSFTDAVNMTNSLVNDTKKVIVIERLESAGKITKQVKELLYELYSIDDKDLPTSQIMPSFGNFGELSSTKISNTKNNSMKENIYLLCDVDDNIQIEVENLDAVCSSDSRYYRCGLNKLIHFSFITEQLAKGADFQVGKSRPFSGSVRITHDEKYASIIRAIDWKKIDKFRFTVDDFINKYGRYTIRINSMNTSCEVSKLRSSKEILSYLKRDLCFEVGTLEINDDCRGTCSKQFKISKDATGYAMKVDWNS